MSQSLEEKKIQSLTKRYKREGYQVVLEPLLPDAPYRPDLVLRRGSELVLVEVVSDKNRKEKQAAIEYLTGYAKENGARFDLVVTNPRTTKLERQSRDTRLLRLLRQRISAELDSLVESNPAAVVILCYVLVENLIQGLVRPESIPSSQGITMVELARRLRRQEVISESAVDFVAQLWNLRNSVLHERLPQLGRSAMNDVLGKTRSLLKNYDRDPSAFSTNR